MLHWKPLQQQVRPPRARAPPALVGPAALQKKGRTVAAAAAIASFSPPNEDFSSLFLPSRNLT